jgi:hypothetical protein
MEMKNFTEKFYCEKCNIICSRNVEWQRHLLTRKHKNGENGNNGNDKFYICDCKKPSKHTLDYGNININAVVKKYKKFHQTIKFSI